MDFNEAANEVKEIEKQSKGGRTILSKVELPKTIDFSPEEFIGKNYRDMLNEYNRLMKIAKTVDASFRQVSAPIYEEKKAEERKEETKLKIKETKSKKAIETVQPPPVPSIKIIPKIIKPSIEPIELEKEKTEPKIKEIKTLEEETKPSEPKSEIKSEELDFEFLETKEEPEKHAEEREGSEIPALNDLDTIEIPEEFEKKDLETKEAGAEKDILIEKQTISQEAKEVIGEAEVPYIKKHEKIVLSVPPFLSLSPEELSERKFSELESKVPDTLEPTNIRDVKKQMIELTKELFKEQSFKRKEYIKEEIARLRKTLSRRDEMPANKRILSYAMALFNALEVDEKIEFDSGKERLMKQYRNNLSTILQIFSDSLKLTKTQDEKNRIYKMFVEDLETLKKQTNDLSDKCLDFFIKEHTLSLERLRTIALAKKDSYVVRKIDERIKEIKFCYTGDFLSLTEAIKNEISSLINSKRHEILETGPDVEMEKVLKIINKKDEELIDYIHFNHPEVYQEFEEKKITKLELLLKAKRLLAEERGINSTLINKYL